MEEDCIAKSGFACIHAASTISIGVSHQLSLHGRAKEPQVESATNITQDVFESTKMRLLRIVHMKINLPDGIGIGTPSVVDIFGLVSIGVDTASTRPYQPALKNVKTGRGHESTSEHGA